MKNICLLTFFTLSTTLTNAKNLDCQINIDNTQVRKAHVITKPLEKVLIDKTDSAVTYITEQKNNNYTLESFIPDYEIRIYSEGQIKEESEKLTLSLWGRESLIETTCQQQIIF